MTGKSTDLLVVDLNLSKYMINILARFFSVKHKLQSNLLFESFWIKKTSSFNMLKVPLIMSSCIRICFCFELRIGFAIELEIV